MLLITLTNLWSLTYFFVLTYLTIVISIFFYVLPTLSFAPTGASRQKSPFHYINSLEIMNIIMLYVFLITLLGMSWSSQALSVWFGHVLFSSLQLKITPILLLTYTAVLYALLSTSYFTSREIYDYLTVTLNFLYWGLLLFVSNTLFATIFIIEVLSTLLFLLLITSAFSSTFFYRNLDLSFGHSFQQSTPYSFLHSILFFFWIALLCSLGLFLFVLVLYTKLFTLDWFLLEHVYMLLATTSSVTELTSIGLAWFLLLICIFLKCGIAPLFFWKPAFFKGLTFSAILVYICFFYFTLFIFLIHMLTSYFSVLLYSYALFLITLVLVGLLTLLAIMCDAVYIKSFLAISSILNSLFVLLAVGTTHTTPLILWL